MEEVTKTALFKATNLLPKRMIKQWYTIKEFAKNAEIRRETLNNWLRKHPNFVIKYCKAVNGSMQRPRYIIHWKGITAYIVEKNGFYGNRYTKGTSTNSIRLKSKITDIVNEEIERQRLQLSYEEYRLLKISRIIKELQKPLEHMTN